MAATKRRTERWSEPMNTRVAIVRKKYNFHNKITPERRKRPRTDMLLGHPRSPDEEKPERGGKKAT